MNKLTKLCLLRISGSGGRKATLDQYCADSSQKRIFQPQVDSRSRCKKCLNKLQALWGKLEDCRRMLLKIFFLAWKLLGWPESDGIPKVSTERLHAVILHIDLFQTRLVVQVVTTNHNWINFYQDWNFSSEWVSSVRLGAEILVGTYWEPTKNYFQEELTFGS